MSSQRKETPMMSINDAQSRQNRDEIFGVKETQGVNTSGLTLRYEVETGQKGEPGYLLQQVLRDENGNYFMAAKGGTDARLGFETPYPLGGREVLIPIRPEALNLWAEHNLCGEECERALEEFKCPKSFEHETVWAYQQGVNAGQEGYIHEFLWKTSDGLYMLFSTDAFYPCPECNISCIDLDEGGACREDLNLYLYYVTSETARRWAQARGMGDAACQMTFDR